MKPSLRKAVRLLQGLWKSDGDATVPVWRSRPRDRAALRRHYAEVLARNPLHPTIEHVVDDRVFLLGLDQMYRSAIKPHERGELLECARTVAATLGVGPAAVPIEGYYAEDAALTEYFRLLRALQAVDKSRIDRVARVRQFRRLLEVTSSPLYGRATDVGRLLPVGHDPLSEALADQFPNWSAERLIARAHDVAIEMDDYSLVGLAALSRDPVVVAALRESVVLYANWMAGLARSPPIPVFVWRVDDRLARQAARFVATFNELFDEDLPVPIPENADELFAASKDAHIAGRCVRIGSTAPPDVRYYHWAIAGPYGEWRVDEFWADEVWTTERYAAESARRNMPARFRDLKRDG